MMKEFTCMLLLDSLPFSKLKVGKGGLARSASQGGLDCSEASGETCFYFPVLKMYFGTFCRALRPPATAPFTSHTALSPPCACLGRSGTWAHDFKTTASSLNTTASSLRNRRGSNLNTCFHIA